MSQLAFSALKPKMQNPDTAYTDADAKRDAQIFPLIPSLDIQAVRKASEYVNQQDAQNEMVINISIPTANGCKRKVKWTNSELQKFIAIVTGQQKEDVFMRLSKIPTTEQETNERKAKMNTGE
jgi:hypothetical protein